jgi:ubiquinone/menaquinone biosynthesis C-methylase UbiE
MKPKHTADYYNETASDYDAMHGDSEPDHTKAFELGWPLVGSDVESVLDVGCGTGRGLAWIAKNNPQIRLSGADPSDSMLSIASKKVSGADLRRGSGENIPFDDKSIDLVTATGIMHHVDDHAKVIAEMFRVARNAVLISDHNNYALGGDMMRRLRMGLKLCGLLRATTYICQGFSRRGYSEEHGWWYPYSLFDNYEEIARRAGQIFIYHAPPSSAGTFYFRNHISRLWQSSAGNE